MEPVDDRAGFEVQLGCQFLDGLRRGVGLLLVGPLQRFFLLRSQDHARLLQLLLRVVLRAGARAEL